MNPTCTPQGTRQKLNLSARRGFQSVPRDVTRPMAYRIMDERARYFLRMGEAHSHVARDLGSGFCSRELALSVGERRGQTGRARPRGERTCKTQEAVA